MTAPMENTPAMSMKRLPFRTLLPSTVSYAMSGMPAPMTTPASVAPMVRNVDRDWRSPGSAEMAEAMEP